MSKALTRRAVMQNLAVAAGIAATLGARATKAADAPRVDVKDPAAKALGYVENASQVDPKKYPSYTKGSSCENCAQLQGASGPSYRPCDLFAGKLVSIGGWCSGWTAEI
jgi:High potential iron-sulfur protein